MNEENNTNEKTNAESEEAVKENREDNFDHDFDEGSADNYDKKFDDNMEDNFDDDSDANFYEKIKVRFKEKTLKEYEKEDKVKRAYGLVIIKEDSQKGISKKFIDTRKIKKAFTILLIVLAVLVLFSVYRSIRLMVMNHSVDRLEEELNLTQSEMDQTVENLQTKNSDLSDKLTFLSNQMTEAMEKEDEQAQKRIPTGLPVSGRVNILEENALAPKVEESESSSPSNLTPHASEMSSDTTEDEETEYLTVFEVQKGSIVMAAADGKVMAITDDFEYGKALWIDHENGYQTVYYYNGESKVKEGDEVLRGTLLFEVGRKKEKVGYQIIQDGYYINPLNLMAISG